MVPSRCRYRSLGDPVIAKGVGYGLSCVRCVQLHEFQQAMPHRLCRKTKISAERDAIRTPQHLWRHAEFIDHCQEISSGCQA